VKDAGPLLTLRHDRAEIGRLSSWLDDRIGALLLDRTVAYAVRLCLEEVVLNAVTHGAPPDGEAGDILVRLDRTPDGLRAWVEDHGPPFDPLSQEAAPLPRTLEEAPLGGLGIRLIRAFASGISYCRAGGANRLTLSFAE
jgi:anti-sigma regulatory factor (Ser/Thr protein kinase)